MRLIWYFAFLFSFSAYASEQVVGIYYINTMFAHLHQMTNPNSVSLTTVACGHPLKVIKAEKSKNLSWFYTEVGAHKGYIQSDFVSERKPDCFQANYPIFFNGLNLDLSQMYYWGRLNDQYLHVEVKAP